MTEWLTDHGAVLIIQVLIGMFYVGVVWQKVKSFPCKEHKSWFDDLFTRAHSNTERIIRVETEFQHQTGTLNRIEEKIDNRNGTK